MRLNKLINKSLLCVGLIAITMQNCTFKDEINRDPNNPTTAPLNSLLTPSEILFAYTWGGNLSRYNGMFTQQLFGFDRQALNIYSYTFTRPDTDDPWDNLYRVLLSSRDMIKFAGSTAPYYAGIAKVLTANTLGTLSSLYGDIPYSEAVKGDDGKTQPKYDSQQSIYASIQALLDAAIVDFTATNTGLKPGADDIIFGGDMVAWNATALALKARYYLHTAKVDPAAYANAKASAQAAIDAGFTTYKITFAGSSATSEAPWYQWRTQRDDIIPNVLMFDKMKAIADPRLSEYFDVTTAGGFNEGFGSYLQSEQGPVVMMYPSELQFILAEANLGLLDAATAETNLVAAVNASYSEIGVTGSYSVSGVTLESVMEQKYYSTYLSPESLIDWRRTGFPAIVPVDGNAVPRKYPYPVKEKNYNGANVPVENTVPFLTRMYIDP